jgi:hypothetical protein
MAGPMIYLAAATSVKLVLEMQAVDSDRNAIPLHNGWLYDWIKRYFEGRYLHMKTGSCGGFFQTRWINITREGDQVVRFAVGSALAVIDLVEDGVFRVAR